MNPGAPVFIPGGGAGHPAPPWPSPPPFPPHPDSPSLPTSPFLPSSTTDSLHTFIMAIIFAYQQGIIAGSTISSTPSSLPISTPSLPLTMPQSSTSAIPPSASRPSSHIREDNNNNNSPSINHHSSTQNGSPPPFLEIIRHSPLTPSIANRIQNTITTPPPPKPSTTPIISPLDYSTIINNLPIGLSGFPLIKPSRFSIILPSTPFRAMSPFTIRKERGRRSKRNGRRSSRRLSNRQSSAIKSKQNNRKGEKKDNPSSPTSINHTPNRFSILASLDTTTPLSNRHQSISTSPLRASTHSSTQLIDDLARSSISCPSDQPYITVTADSSESEDSLLIEAEIEEIVKPLINGVCMNAVMNARCIDITGADIYEWEECDSFINHPSNRPPPPSNSSPTPSTPSSNTGTSPLSCHLCSSEVFSCCPDCSAPLCYPHVLPADDQLAPINSNLLAHNCAAFLLSVADDADRRQKENNDDAIAVQKTQTATTNAKKKAKKKSKGSMNPPPPSTTAPLPTPPPPPPSSTIITRRIFEDLIEKFNSCYDQIKPKKLKNDLNKIIEKLGKKIDAHYDKILFDDDEIDRKTYDALTSNYDIPVTLSDKLADALHSLQSSLASFI